MKKQYNIILILSILISCSSDNETEQNNDDDNIVDPVSNIINFSAKIDSPIQTRDYSYHLGGYEGVFENPDSIKTFNGRIIIDYENNSNQLNSNDIEIVWRSNIDGILFQGNPNNDLGTEITESLTKGVHTIYLEASIPSENLMVKDSLILSNNIKLLATNTGKSVKINWSKYEGADFLSYKLYKENFEPIAEIEDINTLEFEDFESSSFVEDSEYQIIVNTSENYNHPIGSNFEYMHPGIFIEFPYYVHKLIKDPYRLKIYAIVRPRSNGDQSDKYGILIIDSNSKTFEINSHILIEDRFSDLDMSQDGQYLYLCQERVEKITKLNLDTLEATTFITDTNDWGIHKIEVGNNNLLYCHRDPPSSGNTQFWIYDGNTGNLLNGPTGGSRHGDIEFNIENNKLYSGLSNTTGGKIWRHSVNYNSINVDREYPQFPESVYFPEPFILLTDDNQKIFWENFQFDENLNVIRTFDTNIKACSPNNIFLSDFNKLYNFNNMSVVCEFPKLPLYQNTSMVFMDDSTLVFSRSQDENTYFIKVNVE